MAKERSPSEPYLTVAEAAEKLGLTEKALRRRVDKGKVPCYKLGPLLRFKWSELDALPRRVKTREETMPK